MVTIVSREKRVYCLGHSRVGRLKRSSSSGPFSFNHCGLSLSQRVDRRNPKFLPDPGAESPTVCTAASCARREHSQIRAHTKGSQKENTHRERQNTHTNTHTNTSEGGKNPTVSPNLTTFPTPPLQGLTTQ